jgi:hypothetical protein
MGKAWPWKKTKNDHEVRSLLTKHEGNHQYVVVDMVCWHYRKRTPTGWDDVHLPTAGTK